MGQRKKSRRILGECPDGFRQRAFPCRTQIVLVSVLAHQQRAADLRKMFEQPGMPERRTLAARRPVAARFRGARIAETHGHDRHPVGIVEDLPLDLQPLAQAIAAGIVPRQACRMRPCAPAPGRRSATGRQAQPAGPASRPAAAPPGRRCRHGPRATGSSGTSALLPAAYRPRRTLRSTTASLRSSSRAENMSVTGPLRAMARSSAS